MTITINGTDQQVDDGASLEQIVLIVSARTTGVAAAVNGGVVRRSDWSSVQLAPGDEVEVLTAVQGG